MATVDHGILVSVFAALMTSSTVAWASPGHEDAGSDDHAVAHDDHRSTVHTATGSEHTAHPKNLIGFKISGLTAFEHPTFLEMEEHLVFGGGPFYERVLVPNMLEVEFAVLMCRGNGSTVMPIEVLLKKPFHPGRHLTAYLGVGPSLDIVFHEDETMFVPAIVAAGGGYIWVNSHIGLDLEVTVGHLFEHPGLQEVVMSTGPVVHF